MYGEGDNYHLEHSHVIPALIRKCYEAKSNNTDFVVWGSGEAEREFMYSGDLAEILRQIHKERKEVPSLMIVSPGETVKIREVVELIAQIMGFEGKIVFDSSKPEGIMRKNTDNGVFRQYFPDFKFTPLKEGLTKTIAEYIAYPTLRRQ